MAGLSSGAMMVNVLAGAYPDLFQAGAAHAGVPYGCFQRPDMWSWQCSTGQLQKSAQEWGDAARTGYPGKCMRPESVLGIKMFTAVSL